MNQRLSRYSTVAAVRRLEDPRGSEQAVSGAAATVAAIRATQRLAAAAWMTEQAMRLRVERDAD